MSIFYSEAVFIWVNENSSSISLENPGPIRYEKQDAGMK